MMSAIEHSLLTGHYIDTKIYAYTKRNQAGSVYAPKAVYTNSYVLQAKAGNYFMPSECSRRLELGGYADDHLNVGNSLTGAVQRLCRWTVARIIS